MGVIAPADENECRKALSAAFAQNHPVAVRYPRGAGVGAEVEPGLDPLPWGQAEIRRQSTLSRGNGRRVAILAFGTLLYPALHAGDRLDATVVNMRFVKPLDEATVLQLAREHDALVTIEEGAVLGGAGSAVAECVAAAGLAVPMLQLGLPDQFIEHGDPSKLLSMLGLDAAGIEQSIQRRFGTAKLAMVRPAANL
jgi:1-deoxy-D-xylulose-5-phosphate synthase